ncbi:MAG: MBL fold metallo-hydrolase [Roseburia sp.]|nr:MBL fold metallo-hydrolase [Roseburia sp.]
MEILRLVLGQMQTNTYIITEGDSAVVVDPSCSAQTILNTAAQKNAKIECVLLTHAHFDHIGAVAELQRLGAKVYMSALDCGISALNDEFAEFFDIENTVSFDADAIVKDGDVLMLSGHEYKVIATPGHTPDSVCYILDGRIVFSGDTLFKMSVGRTDFRYGNVSEMERSLEKLFALKGEYAVLPGHGDATTLDFERKHNPYVNRYKK